MTLVRAEKQCFIGHLREAGEVFEYEGPPASWLVPVDGSPAVPASAPEVDELAPFRTESGGSPEKLAKIEAEVDDEQARLDAAPAPEPVVVAKPARERKPVDPEKVAVMAQLDAAGIKYFKGADLAKLKSLLPA